MAYIRILQAFLIILAITGFSCESGTDLQTPMTDPLPEEEEVVYNYLALGDSYTIGQGVEEGLRWPVILSTRLKNSGFSLEETKIIARTGWTTRNLIDAIKEENPETFDLVSLLIGVNNQYQGKPFTQFEKELDTLLLTALRLSGNTKRVFVVSIPDYGVTPFGESNKEQIAEELDEYNNYTQMRCKDLKIPFINITDISRNLGNSEGALASDSLHPSGLQYLKWVDRIYPVVEEIMTAR